MNSNQPSIKHTCIDGQEILFPSQEDWETLRLNAFIDDMPLVLALHVQCFEYVASQCKRYLLALSQ